MQHLLRPCSAVFLAFSMVFSGLIMHPGSAHAQSAEQLKAQLGAMQEKMSEMQQNMEKLQKRLDQLEAAPAPSEVAQKAPEKEAPSVWSDYNIRLYGRVKADFHYDTAELNVNDWVRAIEYEEDYENETTNFNPRDTRIGLEATHQWDDWTGRGRIEVDFYGDNAGNNLLPRMRLGYVDLSHKNGTSIRLGQDWIPISRLNPATIDFGILSSAGNLWWRIPQATVRHKMGKYEFLLSA